MIRHIVLTRFAPETPEETVAAIYAGLSALTDRLPGARDFVGGPSSSPEDLERGYTHAFTIDFHSWADLEAYARDPDHRALGARIVENALGGLDGILVVDLDLPDPARDGAPGDARRPPRRP